MNYTFPIVGVLLVVLGSLAVCIIFVLLLRKIWKVTRATKTTGTVLNVEVRQGGRQTDFSTRNTLFKPTVRFQTAEGRVIDFTPNTSNNWSNYRVGEQVPVYYDPQRPEKPIVGRAYNLWFPFFVFGLVSGLLVLVGGIFVLVGMGLSL